MTPDQEVKAAKLKRMIDFAAGSFFGASLASFTTIFVFMVTK